MDDTHEIGIAVEQDTALPIEVTGRRFEDATAAALEVESPMVGPIAPAGGIAWPFPPLNPRVVSKTTTTVTMGWTPIPACGYRFSVDGRIVSSTWNEAMSQTRFSRPQDGLRHIYEVEPILMGPGEKVQL
jgi:hypothetical protein